MIGQAGAGNRLATPANNDPGGVSWLYVTANAANTDGPVKIGLSATPVRRLKTFQTASAIPLKLHHVQEVPANRVLFLEWAVHTALRRHRLSGEDFTVSVEIAVAEVALAIIHHADDPPRRPGAPVSVGRWSAVYHSTGRVSRRSSQNASYGHLTDTGHFVGIFGKYCWHSVVQHDTPLRDVTGWR